MYVVNSGQPCEGVWLQDAVDGLQLEVIVAGCEVSQLAYHYFYADWNFICKYLILTLIVDIANYGIRLL